MKTKRHYNPEKINIITLGCSKNLVDSEVMLTQLQAGGLRVTHEDTKKDAGVVIINTCGFIDRAKAESIETILAYEAEKKKGNIEKLYVTGCLSERYRDDLREEMPLVDGFFGTQDLPDLLKTFHLDYKHDLIGARQTTTESHYAYLKISEGCDRPCSFCAIPIMRGSHRSRSLESLVEEATFLAERGVKELMLIAQDSTFYGIDLYGKRYLSELLTALAGVDGIRWIRLHYAYPAGFPLEVLPVIANHDNICNYIDIPLQHIADPILKAMRRGINRQKTIELIQQIRATIPSVALRTTMLVGYPGETDADFDELLAFVEATKFERLGAFMYSHEENTHAYHFEDNVPDDVKQARYETLMAVQQSISFDLNRQKIGQTLLTLIDRREGNMAIGRTEYDSPEVDNEVCIFDEKHELQPGNFYPIFIDDATEFDLLGRLVSEPMAYTRQS